MSQNPNAKKRRREAYNIDVKLVEIYEDLANEKEDIRLKAAHKLVSRFTPEANPTANEVQKALQRLFRGLSSGRKAARIGFSIALTEVLSQVFSPNKSEELAELSVTKVVDVWESSTRVGGGERGQEHRDHHFGRLFGAEAIIKSSILFQDPEFEQWSRVLNLIFDLGKKKPWLREECGWILYRAIYELASQKIPVKYAESIVEGVFSNELAKTPEGVAVWLAVKDLFPTATLPSNVWKYNDPLDRHDRKTLSKVMKESSAADETAETEDLAKNSSGVWNAKLHFAWDAVLARLYESETTDKKSKGPRLDFSDFWVEVVDNGLFAAASSDERKYWGFLVFMKILNEAPSQLAGQIFTKNLVRCLMNQIADKERYLNRMAVKAAKTIQTRVTKEPEFAAAAAGGLMGPSGSVNFDQLTKSNTIEKTVVEAGPAALKSIIDLLAGFITVPGSEETNVAASTRNYISRLFVSIVKPRSSTGGEFQPLLEEILFVLVRSAYFADETAKPPVSQATQELFRNKINLCLNGLVSSNKDPAGVAYAVVRQVRNLQKTNEHGKFIIDMDETISESVDAAFKSLKKLSSKVKHDEDKIDPSVQAFRLLYSLTILEVYNGDADAVSMLDELAFCYTKFWGDKKPKKEDKSDASNALVEILLSFASKPSQLFRRMSEQVFGVFAEQITADGLQSLISVLEVKENLAGQQEMFDNQDDEDEEMPDADEDSDDDSDADSVEVIDADEAENDESEEEEEEDEDEGENEEELAAFDAKLAEALGTNGDNQDVDSDSDMDDDEMEAVDEMLVKVFKERRKAITKKKDKKDAKETMTNFKNRVLDLLQVYIKKCHSSMLALDLILPLLQLTRRSTVDQISQKAGNLLAEYTSLCKRNAIPTLSKSDDDEEHDPVEAVWELLRSVHKEATIQHRQKHSASVSQASLLLVRVLVAQDRQNIAQVIDIYAETQKTQMLSKNGHFKSGFFADWNAWCVNFGKNSKR